MPKPFELIPQGPFLRVYDSNDKELDFDLSPYYEKGAQWNELVKKGSAEDDRSLFLSHGNKTLLYKSPSGNHASTARLRPTQLQWGAFLARISEFEGTIRYLLIGDTLQVIIRPKNGPNGDARFSIFTGKK